MIIKSLFSADVAMKTLTVDGKHLNEFTEREVDNLRRRVANLLRTQQLSADKLAYIITSIALQYGELDYSEGVTNKILVL